MKVLLTGASGQVGRALQAAAPAGTELTALAREDLDIGDPKAVGVCLTDIQPELIINAAAYTAVDRAESEPELALRVNGMGPRYLAEAARRDPRCRLLQISTDYVFNGRNERPYSPEDTPDPLGVYGRSKLEGETAVLGLLPERSAILRTSWVHAPRGRNFVLTMLRLMRERGVVRVVADQSGVPTAAASVARALWRLAALPRVTGILHWTDAGCATWYQFACAIAEEAARLGLASPATAVVPITTAQYPSTARRPAHSVLDLSASAERLGLDPLPWRDCLRTTLRQIREAA